MVLIMLLSRIALDVKCSLDNPSFNKIDEVFIVLEGILFIDFDHERKSLSAGEMIVVPKGVNHRPSSEDECHILLVEPSGVVNTGDAGGELTAPNDAWI